MTNSPPTCIYCEQSEHTVPLLSFQYQGSTYWICPQHLPILIHQPAKLADKLQGLELLKPAEGHP
jgi:hypothetical protein